MINLFSVDDIIQTILKLNDYSTIIKFSENTKKVVFYFEHYNIHDIYFDQNQNSTQGTKLYGSVFILCSGNTSQTDTLTDKYTISCGGVEIESMRVMDYIDKNNNNSNYAPEYGTVRMYFAFSDDLMLLFDLFDNTKKKLFMLNLISQLRKKKPTQNFERMSLYIRLLYALHSAFIENLNIKKEHECYLDIVCQN